MAVDPAAVLTAIKTRIETISGLSCKDRVPELVDPPMAVPSVKSVDFDESMGRGTDHYTFSIAVIVSRADAETAQTKLLAYLNASGSSSVKAALEGGTPARTLGGTVSACQVSGVPQIDVVLFGDVPYLFAEFDLDVYG